MCPINISMFPPLGSLREVTFSLFLFPLLWIGIQPLSPAWTATCDTSPTTDLYLCTLMRVHNPLIAMWSTHAKGLNVCCLHMLNTWKRVGFVLLFGAELNRCQILWRRAMQRKVGRQLVHTLGDNLACWGHGFLQLSPCYIERQDKMRGWKILVWLGAWVFKMQFTMLTTCYCSRCCLGAYLLPSYTCLCVTANKRTCLWAFKCCLFSFLLARGPCEVEYFCSQQWWRE